MDAKRFSRAKILLQHHASNARNLCGYFPLIPIIWFALDPSTTDDMGRNALHYAFRCNAPHDVIKELVRYDFVGQSWLVFCLGHRGPRHSADIWCVLKSMHGNNVENPDMTWLRRYTGRRRSWKYIRTRQSETQCPMCQDWYFLKTLSEYFI